MAIHSQGIDKKYLKYIYIYMYILKYHIIRNVLKPASKGFIRILAQVKEFPFPRRNCSSSIVGGCITGKYSRKVVTTGTKSKIGFKQLQSNCWLRFIRCSGGKKLTGSIDDLSLYTEINWNESPLKTWHKSGYP